LTVVYVVAEVEYASYMGTVFPHTLKVFEKRKDAVKYAKKIKDKPVSKDEYYGGSGSCVILRRTIG
jgi:hypothetical protein